MRCDVLRRSPVGDAEVYLAKSFGNHTFNFTMKLDDKLGSDHLPRYEYFQWGGFL